MPLHVGAVFDELAILKWELACESSRQNRMHHITRIDAHRFQASCAWKSASPTGHCTFTCTAVSSTEILRPISRTVTTINLDSSDDECVCVVTSDASADHVVDEPSSLNTDDADARDALNGVLANMSEADLAHLQLWRVLSVQPRHSCHAAPTTKAGQKATPFDPSMFVADSLHQVTIHNTCK
jgi:hypothetical protein